MWKHFDGGNILTVEGHVVDILTDSWGGKLHCAFFFLDALLVRLGDARRGVLVRVGESVRVLDLDAGMPVFDGETRRELEGVATDERLGETDGEPVDDIVDEADAVRVDEAEEVAEEEDVIEDVSVEVDVSDEVADEVGVIDEVSDVVAVGVADTEVVAVGVEDTVGEGERDAKPGASAMPRNSVLAAATAMGAPLFSQVREAMPSAYTAEGVVT